MATSLLKGENSVTIKTIDADWDYMSVYSWAGDNGVLLKGMIFIPGSGGPDTFSIKDGSDAGPYLYYGPVSATTSLVYPGSFCRPYIDYSECTLSSGHMITLLW